MTKERRYNGKITNIFVFKSQFDGGVFFIYQAHLRAITSWKMFVNRIKLLREVTQIWTRGLTSHGREVPWNEANHGRLIPWYVQ